MPMRRPFRLGRAFFLLFGLSIHSLHDLFAVISMSIIPRARYRSTTSLRVYLTASSMTSSQVLTSRSVRALEAYRG